MSVCLVQDEKKNDKMSTKCHDLPNTEATYRKQVPRKSAVTCTSFPVPRNSWHAASISTKLSWYLDFNRTQTNKKPILSTRSVFMSVWNTLFMFTLMCFVSIMSQMQLIRTCKRDAVGPGSDADLKRKSVQSTVIAAETCPTTNTRKES